MATKRKIFLETTRVRVIDIIWWTSTKIVQIMTPGSILAPPGAHLISYSFYRENFKTSFQKLYGLELRYLLFSMWNPLWISTKIVQMMAPEPILAPPWGSPDYT